MPGESPDYGELDDTSSDDTAAAIRRRAAPPPLAAQPHAPRPADNTGGEQPAQSTASKRARDAAARAAAKEQEADSGQPKRVVSKAPHASFAEGAVSYSISPAKQDLYLARDHWSRPGGCFDWAVKSIGDKLVKVSANAAGALEEAIISNSLDSCTLNITTVNEALKACLDGLTRGAAMAFPLDSKSVNLLCTRTSGGDLPPVQRMTFKLGTIDPSLSEDKKSAISGAFARMLLNRPDLGELINKLLREAAKCAKQPAAQVVNIFSLALGRLVLAEVEVVATPGPILREGIITLPGIEVPFCLIPRVPGGAALAPCDVCVKILLELGLTKKADTLAAAHTPSDFCSVKLPNGLHTMTACEALATCDLVVRTKAALEPTPKEAAAPVAPDGDGPQQSRRPVYQSPHAGWQTAHNKKSRNDDPGRGRGGGRSGNGRGSGRGGSARGRSGVHQQSGPRPPPSYQF